MRPGARGAARRARVQPMTTSPRSSASPQSRAALPAPVMWSAFLHRDARYDGRFVAAVRTTGIFCRPSCTCRKPRRENVRWFPDPGAAARAGFRPCKRCRPELAGGAAAADRALAIRVLALVRGEPGEPWSVARLAHAVAMSAPTLSRRFRAGDGRGVAEAVRAVRLEVAAARLRSGAAVLDTALACGFASASAFARAFRRRAGMLPSEVRRRRTEPTPPRRSA
jgi:methylphosphotriester-DNA--protein-cysteine methyltransferase